MKHHSPKRRAALRYARRGTSFAFLLSVVPRGHTQKRNSTVRAKVRLVENGLHDKTMAVKLNFFTRDTFSRSVFLFTVTFESLFADGKVCFNGRANLEINFSMFFKSFESFLNALGL